MSKRTVTLKLSTQRDLVTHESSARTFAELKQELSGIVNFDNVKVIERSKKVTLEADDAILPATNFMVFVVPQKVKSGSVETLNDINTATYNELRSHGSYLNKSENAGLDLSGNTEQIRTNIMDYYMSNTNVTPSVDDTVVLVEEARAFVNETFDTLIELLSNKENQQDEGNIVMKLTMEDLNEELNKIRHQLGL
jgi:hypothetical protein